MAADAAAATAAGAVCDVQEPQDYSENGFFPYTNGYDFAQFYNSLCYPNWFMDQCRMYDDAGLPLYCGGEYAMTNEEVYGHQPSFKKRKKRFRTFEEMPALNGN
ncbi:AGAP012232-PA, partial [Anopheles gambiae str. PEST]